DAERGERVARRELRTRADLDEAVETEHRTSRLPFEVAPAGECLLGELDPVPVRIREAEDAGAPVARPVRVVELELLEEGDVRAPCGERPRRRAAHDACADDGDARHRTSVLRNTPMPGTSSSTVSPAPNGPSVRSTGPATMSPG